MMRPHELAATGRRALLLAALLALLLVAAGAAAQDAAPDFTRRELSGRLVRLSQYRGRVVLLSFWATWCEPCLVEAPLFSAWQKTYRDRGLQVLGVAMDDDETPVRATARRYHLVYPVVMGDAELGALYGGVLGLPFSLLIDRSGRIVARFRGEPALKDMERQLAGLLAPSPRAGR